MWMVNDKKAGSPKEGQDGGSSGARWTWTQDEMLQQQNVESNKPILLQ